MPEIKTCGICDTVLPRSALIYTYIGPLKSPSRKLRGFLSHGWVSETFCCLNHLLTWLASNVED